MTGQYFEDRLRKLQAIRALGVDPYGGRLTGVLTTAEIREKALGLDLQAGQTSERPEAVARAAGRVILYRDIGKLIFLTIRDQHGELQLGISKGTLESAAGAGTEGRREEGTKGNAGASPASGVSPATGFGTARPGESVPLSGPVGWQVAKLLDLGDIIGADGRLGKTKTGELTLWVTHLHMLSKALRPPPEKYHGLTDVEARYRRRYVDLFANPESREIFLKRAKIIAHIRGVLHRRGFVEVETPVLQPIYGGAAARPFTTHHNTLDMRLYLRISPELYLKRCLVGGLERVYEFARCFRNEGISPRHNPEFTMLELYQAYGDYHDMMEITEEIIAGAARDVIGSYQIPFGERTIDYTPPWPRRRYGDLLREHVGVDLNDREGVLRKARELGILARLQKAQAAVERGAEPAEVNPPGMEQLPHAEGTKGGAGGPPTAELHVDHALLVNALFEELVEHHLINPTFVIDYPAPLCPLTRRHPSDPSLALRFEAYVNGMEMGNAYSELNDPAVQRANFAAAVEGEGDETMRVMDEDFCQALEHGMPPAGGLGIGIDRLCMLLTGSQSIREVILFPLQRPER